MQRSFYLDHLYPLQDRVLARIAVLDTAFYLSGGTAVSRAYLDHRFSEDLDLFVNDADLFVLWADRIVDTLTQGDRWRTEVLMREKRFVRLQIRTDEELVMKIEMVNDVPSHIGEIRSDPVLGRVDSPENLLANKLTALADREEPKDLADVWGLSTKLGLSITQALEDARSKAAGLFPADLARILISAERSDWELIRWNHPPDPDRFVAGLHALGEELLLSPACE